MPRILIVLQCNFMNFWNVISSTVLLWATTYTYLCYFQAEYLLTKKERSRIKNALIEYDVTRWVRIQIFAVYLCYTNNVCIWLTKCIVCVDA